MYKKEYKGFTIFQNFKVFSCLLTYSENYVVVSEKFRSIATNIVEYSFIDLQIWVAREDL